MHLKRFYKEFLSKYKYIYIGIFILSLIQMAFVMITPQIQSALVNTIPESIEMKKFITLIIALVISLVASYTFDFIQQFLISKNSEELASDLREKLNNKCSKIKMKYYDSNTFSDLASKFQKEVGIVQVIGADIFIELTTNVFKFVTAIVIMINISVKITLIIIGSLIFYAILSRYLGKIIKEQTEKNLQYNEEILDIANENFDNSLCIKLNDLSEYANNRFKNINSKYKKSNIKLGFIYLLSRNVAVYTILLGLVFIWIFGGISMVNGEMTIGDVLALISYQSILFTPVGYFSEFNNIYNSSVTAINKLYEFFDIKDERSEGNPINAIDKIELENVKFAYNDKNVLKNIKLKLRKGNIYTIIGKSGCGKTTLIKLLTAIYEKNYGEILINNKELDNINLKYLRNEIAISLQENSFFDDSVINNLKFDNDIKEEEICAIAEKLDLLDDINKLSNGWQTNLGRKANVSTGQAKRLDLLRIFLKKSSVIILDEPPSCLDNKRKRKFYDYLESIREEKIIILITHNLEEMKNANYIYLLKDGELRDITDKKDIDYMMIYE